MRLFHTSPGEIKEIYNSEYFGDCLFFSSSEYVMTQAKTVYIYSYEIDEEKIIDTSDLYDKEIIDHIADVLEIDAENAERVLDGRDTAFDHGGDGEDDWWIQGQQGECAKKMGYEAVQSRDEQGAVYIVPMTGKLERMKLEKIEDQ